jgi:hypothetical protein
MSNFVISIAIANLQIRATQQEKRILQQHKQQQQEQQRKATKRDSRLQAELAPCHCVFPRMDRDKDRPRAIHLQQLAHTDLDTCHQPLDFRR